MSRVRVTEYTSSTVVSAPPASVERSRGSAAVLWSPRNGGLQWLLEGPGREWATPTLDLALLAAAVLLALHGVHGALHVSSALAPILLLPPVVLGLLYQRGAYRRQLRVLAIDELVGAVSAVSVATMSVAMLGFLINGQVTGQAIWLRGWLFALLGVAVSHTGLAVALRVARASRAVGRPALIVGAGVVGGLIARRLDTHPEYGLRAIGFLDDDVHLIPGPTTNDVPVLGRIEAMADVVRRTGVRDLIVAFSTTNDARLSPLIESCQALGVEVSVVPRLFDTINQRISYDTLGGLPLLRFEGVDPTGLPFAIKHVFDRIIAGVGLILISPLLLALALAVRLASPGPVLFRQRRVGRDGREFDLFKFRTMRTLQAQGEAEDAADELALRVHQGNAPGGVEGVDRRTPVGRIMRRCSLDELPQLFNVLRGEMSLVGPRPERPEFVELFGHSVPRYAERHRVKSGITGWAQVHGLRGKTSLADRVEWDNYYIAHWSMYLDLKIMLLTLQALVRGE